MVVIRLDFTGESDQEVTAAFIKEFQQLCVDLEVPLSFKAAGIDAAKFEQCISKMAEDAFDDQCTPGNPRFPLVVELEGILRKAYHGNDIKV
jgi:acetaldehyde dehydrogenase / alcohol dehydrogenase